MSNSRIIPLSDSITPKPAIYAKAGFSLLSPLSVVAHRANLSWTMIHHRMYGDLIVGLLAVMTLFSLIHEYILLVRKETDVPFHVALLGPSVICIHEVYILLVCARSFLYQSRVASYLVFLSISMFSQLTSSYQWPAPVASNLTSTFCVQLCVLLANTPHAVFTKMVLGLVGTMHVIFLSSASPLNSLQVDLPNVIIYVVVFLSVEVGALLYFSNGNIDVIESGELKNPSRLSSSTWSYPTFRSWAPTWIVGAVYFYFLSIEVVPIILQEGYFEKDPSRLFSTIVYGFCGLAATFYFHDKSDNDRARQAAKQDDGATENDLPAMSVAPKGENDQHKRSMHFSKDDMLRNTSSLPDDGGFMDNMVQRIVSQQGMYGDFFTSFTSAVATPCVFHDCGLLFHKNEYSVMETLGPLLIAAMMFMTALFSFVSIFYNSKEASYASFASCLVVSSLVCFYQWPTQIADGVLGNFAWHLVMVTANTSHSRFSKVAMALLATTSALTLSYLSPIYTLSTNFPFIFGFMVAFSSFQVWSLYLPSTGNPDMYKSGNKRTLKVSSMTLGWPSTHSQALAWALGIVFASIITWEVVAIMRQEGYAATSVYKIIFVFLCYSCGLVCASALHEKAELRRYGKIIAENNIMLKMAATALNASSTAIAVVDGRRSVMLFNSAFQDVSGNSRDSDLGRKQLERVLKLTSDQTLTLMMCFQHVSPATAVFVLEGRAVRVTISFLLNDFVERSFHVVLTDIANEHAAVSLAQREALETLAIMQAVEELTYRVGQPQNLDVAQYIPRIDIIPDHHDDYLDEPGYYR